MWHKTQLRMLYIVALVIGGTYIAYSQYQQSQRFFEAPVAASARWHVAATAAEFKQLLAQAPKGQKIIIDVYADWCVACQPIEHRILKSATVRTEHLHRII